MSGEQELLDLVHTANSVVLRCLPSGEMTFVNDYAHAFFGYDAGELVGRNVMILIPEKESTGRDLSNLFGAVVKQPDRYSSITNENVRKDGARVWVSWTNKAILYTAGDIREILSVGNDVTAQKRAEAAIADLAKFPRENPNPVLRISCEGELLYANAASEAVLETWRCRPGGTLSEPWCSIIRTAASEKTAKTHDLQCGHRVYSLSIVPVADKGYVNVYAMDITEQRRALEELRSSENRYRMLFENMNEGFFLGEMIYDEKDHPVDYRHLAANPALESVVGMKVEDLVGKTRSEVLPTASRWLDMFARVSRTRRPEQLEEYSEALDRYFNVSCYSPQPDRFACFIEDITARKKAEITREESEHRLRLLNENLEDLVVKRTEQVNALSKSLSLAEQRERKRLSYELHETLQQQLLGARMLLREHARDHRQEAVSDECDDVAQAVSMLERALKTTRSLAIELNPPVLRSEGLDAALRWLVEHLRKNYGLEVTLTLEGAVGLIRNETQLMLTQMVRDLLSNVIQHAGVNRAQLSALCRKGHVVITVRDQGCGFDPAVVLRKRPDGTRQGLFIIQERLHLFGGEMTIESTEGGGTRTVISLPMNICIEGRNGT
jgi:PAS domain S-box-containing protein